MFFLSLTISPEAVFGKSSGHHFDGNSVLKMYSHVTMVFPKHENEKARQSKNAALPGS